MKNIFLFIKTKFILNAPSLVLVTILMCRMRGDSEHYTYLHAKITLMQGLYMYMDAQIHRIQA